MSKIDELLNNEKVEWKKLGEVCEIIRGVRITKKELLENGSYPVISGGTGYMGYVNKYNRDENTITIAQYGTAGYVSWQKEKFWANDVCFSVYSNEKVLKKYLYYFLLHKQEYLYSISNKSAVPYSISKEKLLKIKIPIPSLETQQKIVEILDKFTDYVTELQAELQGRTKQYDYYRDLLLSEDYLNKLSNSPEIFKEMGNNTLPKIEWKKLEEISIGGLTYGSGASAVKYDGITRYIRITDINDNGGLKNEKVSPSVIEDKYVLNEGDILFARSGATVGKNYIHLDKQKSIYAGYLIRLIVNPEVALSKFVYYYLNTSDYSKFVERTKSGGSQPNINAKQYGDFKIPIVPIWLQEKVVEVLDKFTEMLNDTKGLLPQEIEQRQKQYEYYREKLLTFNLDSETISRQTDRQTDRQTGNI